VLWEVLDFGSETGPGEYTRPQTLVMAGILFIISAPSGSGKSTLVSEVRRLVEGLEFSISYTTRAPRGSEQDGQEYHFTTREEFLAMVSRGEFLEWAEVFGNFYGTPISGLAAAAKQGRDLLLDIDVQGALQVMERVPNAVSIFILTPNPQELEKRLRLRSQGEGVTQEAVIERRLSEARLELLNLDRYQYALVNDVVMDAAAEMRAIVLAERGEGGATEQALAQRCLTERKSDRLRAALESFQVELAGTR
jgi:guanylate kinase